MLRDISFLRSENTAVTTRNEYFNEKIRYKTKIENCFSPKMSTTSIDSIDNTDESPSTNLLLTASSEYIVRRKDDKAKGTSTKRRKTLLTSGINTSTRSFSSVASTSNIRLLNSPNIKNDDFDLSQKKTMKSKMSVQSSGQLEASSWELWWLYSPLWKRKAFFYVFLLVILAIMNLVAAFVLFAFPRNVSDPYLCKTENCNELSLWLVKTRNESFNPCEDFYEFACHNFPSNRKDNLHYLWTENFARIEGDRDSIFAGMLQRKNDPLSDRIIQYYHTCLEIWQSQPFNFSSALTYTIQHIFKNFSLKNVSATPTLEDIAIRMIKLVGDHGFFKILPPTRHPQVLIGKRYLNEFTEKNLRQFLPIIYYALGIDDLKWRSEITSDFFDVMGKLSSIIKFGLPRCHVEDPDYKNCYDEDPNNDAKNCKTNFAIINSLKMTYLNISKRDDPRLRKDDYTMFKTDTDPNEGPIAESHFTRLINCWNYLIDNSVKEENIRSVYAVFWSVRLLMYVVDEIEDKTVTQYGIVDNPLFEYYVDLFHGRPKEIRCFYSLFLSMGFYPTFLYFKDMDTDAFKHEADEAVGHVADSLAEEFRPAEEGGLSFVSSFYRERILKILEDRKEKVVLIPIAEDDPTFLESPLSKELEVGKNHIDNLIRWREFMMRRTLHHWNNKTPKGKLIWHREFFDIEYVNTFEVPGTTDVEIIKFPPSFFVQPFWKNDIQVANYAASMVMLVKSWMKLLEYDYADANIERDVESKSGGFVYTEDGVVNNNDSNLKQLYREGVATDGIFKTCEVLTFNWFYQFVLSERPEFVKTVNRLVSNEKNIRRSTAIVTDPDEIVDEEDKATNNHQQIITNPQFLAFRHGHRNYTDRRAEIRISHQNAIFPIYIATKVVYKRYFKDLDNLLKFPSWELQEAGQNFTKHRKLVNHEKFTDEQLFFLLAFRNECRNKENRTTRDYFHHVTENLVALTQMKEFAEAWHCPPASPMNPSSRCFE